MSYLRTKEFNEPGSVILWDESEEQMLEDMMLGIVAKIGQNEGLLGYTNVCVPLLPEPRVGASTSVGCLSKPDIEELLTQDKGVLYVLWMPVHIMEGETIIITSEYFSDWDLVRKKGTIQGYRKANVLVTNLLTLNALTSAELGDDDTVSIMSALEIVNERNAERLRIVKDNFLKAKKLALLSAASALDNAEAILRNTKARLVQVAIDVETQTILYDALNRKAKDFEGEFDALQAEVLELLAHKKIQEIELRVGLNNAILLWIRTVKDMGIVDDGGYTHIIGQLDVSVDLTTSEICIHNIDNKIDTMGDCLPHPHVNPAGAPCLGNLALPLSEAVIAGDIGSVWNLVLSYLESYNKNDIWGIRLRRWPAYTMVEGALTYANLSKGEIDLAISGKSNLEPQDRYRCTSCGTNLLDEEDYTNDDGEIDNERLEDRVCDIGTCDSCGAFLCYDCQRYSSDEDACYCPDCSNYCESCQTYHSTDTGMYECSWCAEWSCDRGDEVRGDIQVYDGPDGFTTLEGTFFCTNHCLERYLAQNNLILAEFNGGDELIPLESDEDEEDVIQNINEDREVL
jgi:hypothetical protein